MQTDSVAELLASRNIQYQLSGNDYVIKCLNPEHEDNNPSCRVDRFSGKCHCFSCGFKTNIFKFFNVVNNRLPGEIQKLKEKLEVLKAATTGLEYPEGSVPFSKPFRGIRAKTLKHFNTFYNNKVPALTDRIIFPITDISGKIRVFVARHMHSNSNPKYINYPKHVEIPLFPPTVPLHTDYAILVEGIFDFLNLYDKGLENCICVFGTNTLQKNTSMKLLPLKAQGVSKIFILFDGDKAGRAAASFLKPLIEAEGFEVEVLDLPNDVDPGELSEEDVLSIKEYCAK